jgi:hypothetical protein
MINADEFVQAMDPPAVTVGGKTYTGRLLSAREAEKLKAEIVALSDDSTDTAVLELICNAFEIPHEPLLELPPAAIQAVILDFFTSLRSMPELSRLRTNGTSQRQKSSGGSEKEKRAKTK